MLFDGNSLRWKPLQYCNIEPTYDKPTLEKLLKSCGFSLANHIFELSISFNIISHFSLSLEIIKGKPFPNFA